MLNKHPGSFPRLDLSHPKAGYGDNKVCREGGSVTDGHRQDEMRNEPRHGSYSWNIWPIRNTSRCTWMHAYTEGQEERRVMAWAGGGAEEVCKRWPLRQTALSDKYDHTQILNSFTSYLREALSLSHHPYKYTEYLLKSDWQRGPTSRLFRVVPSRPDLYASSSTAYKWTREPLREKQGKAVQPSALQDQWPLLSSVDTPLF